MLTRMDATIYISPLDKCKQQSWAEGSLKGMSMTLELLNTTTLSHNLK